MRHTLTLLTAALIALSASSAALAQNAKPRNLILFVPDGLRGRIVTPQTAPAMAELRDKGVNFRNSHSLFPTFTMANGSAMASPICWRGSSRCRRSPTGWRARARRSPGW